jgi:hypothetical protein
MGANRARGGVSDQEERVLYFFLLVHIVIHALSRHSARAGGVSLYKVHVHCLVATTTYLPTYVPTPCSTPSSTPRTCRDPLRRARPKKTRWNLPILPLCGESHRAP